jgi:hypothetical protein
VTGGGVDYAARLKELAVKEIISRAGWFDIEVVAVGV